MSSLKVEMVAADRKVWEGEAKFVEGERRTVTVDGGFLSVDSDVVTIVAEHVDASSLQTN